MKIAIVGAGAMGSLFGAMLAQTGNEVWLYDIWDAHVTAINRDGLQIEKEDQVRIVQLRATTDPDQIGTADLTIIFVKSTQTRSAAATAGRIAGADGGVMTLQNGMGNADLIAENIPADRILAGTTSHGATMLGAGHIRHAGTGPTTIGSWAATGQGRRRAEDVAAFLNQAGIIAEAVEDVYSVVWNKLLINIGINAITALSGIKNGQILDLDVTRRLSRLAVEEAIAVARALGINIKEDAVDIVFNVSQATAANRSSMGQDVDNKRQTEIAAINGYVVREAERLGLDAPINFALTALIETLQAHYD